MTDRPRYYQPLEIPAYSILWEAVMWVAFGRFPDGNGYQDEAELNEELGMLSFAWQDSFGGPRHRFRGFWWFESEMAGVDTETVDWDRYEAALRSGYMRRDALERDLQHAVANDGRKGPNENPMLPAFVEQERLYRIMCEKALEESSFVEDVHSLYRQAVDRGWSRIFQALVDGSLKAYGWGDLTQDEIRQRAAKGDLVDLYSVDAEGGVGHVMDGNVINPWHSRLPEADIIGPLLQMGECKEIPRKEWSLSGIAPDGRYIAASGRNWWDVCIQTDQLFDLFPRPLLKTGVEQEVIDLVNPGLAISVDGTATGGGAKAQKPATGATRGRKKLQDGEVERACHALYGRRWHVGENRDALHAEASAFAMQVWNVNLPRSTFQGYMAAAAQAPKMLPEIVPEIAAE